MEMLDDKNNLNPKKAVYKFTFLKIILDTLNCFKRHEIFRIKNQASKNTDTESRKKFIDGILSFLAFYKTKWNDKQKTEKRGSIN